MDLEVTHIPRGSQSIERLNELHSQQVSGRIGLKPKSPDSPAYHSHF